MPACSYSCIDLSLILQANSSTGNLQPALAADTSGCPALCVPSLWLLSRKAGQSGTRQRTGMTRSDPVTENWEAPVQQLGIATVETEPAECISCEPEQLLLSKKWVCSAKSWGSPGAAFTCIPAEPGLPFCPWGGSSTTWGSCSQWCVPCLIHAWREWGLLLVSTFSGRRRREYPSGWERGSNRQGTRTLTCPSQPALAHWLLLPGTVPILAPAGMSALQWTGFPFSLPKSCCTGAGND